MLSTDGQKGHNKSEFAPMDRPSVAPTVPPIVTGFIIYSGGEILKLLLRKFSSGVIGDNGAILGQVAIAGNAIAYVVN